MGFSIGDVLSIAAPIVGASFGPVGFAVGGAIGGAFASQEAAQQQERALRAAGRIEEAEQLRLQQLQQQFLQETAGFRELAREQIPLLREEALAAPGTSPLFQQGLQRGQAAIQRGFGPRGLAGSSAEALATGELGAGLLAQDIGRISQLRAGLAGFGTTGFGQAAGLQGLQAQLAGMRAQTQAGIGGVQAAGTQALGGLGAQVGALGLLGGLFGTQTPFGGGSLVQDPFAPAGVTQLNPNVAVNL